jgi:hypothetical protein
MQPWHWIDSSLLAYDQPRPSAVLQELAMSPLSRRTFTESTLASLLGYAFLETVFRGEVFSAEMKLVARKWLADLHAMGQDLKDRKLKATEWQTKVEELFTSVDVAEFLKFIDFEKLTANVKYPTSGEKSMRATWPKVEGLPTNLVFGHQVFALGKGRSVVPHGHDNMATAFLILKGDFRGRLFDRLEDPDDDHMIIKPTVDRKFALGEASTISDDKDNVHWFQAETEGSYIFNIHVMNVTPNFPRPTGRVYVDPNGEKLSDGRIRARKVGSDEIYKLYG